MGDRVKRCGSREEDERVSREPSPGRNSSMTFCDGLKTVNRSFSWSPRKGLMGPILFGKCNGDAGQCDAIKGGAPYLASANRYRVRQRSRCHQLAGL
jgi:hypothetical protein